MWCALLAPFHLESHFVHTIPWNDVPLLFKCSPVYETLRQTDTRCYCSYHNYCKEDSQRWPVWHSNAIWCQKTEVDLSRIRYC